MLEKETVYHLCLVSPTTKILVQCLWGNGGGVTPGADPPTQDFLKEVSSANDRPTTSPGSMLGSPQV